MLILSFSPLFFCFLLEKVKIHLWIRERGQDELAAIALALILNCVRCVRFHKKCRYLQREIAKNKYDNENDGSNKKVFRNFCRRLPLDGAAEEKNEQERNLVQIYDRRHAAPVNHRIGVEVHGEAAPASGVDLQLNGL